MSRVLNGFRSEHFADAMNGLTLQSLQDENGRTDKYPMSTDLTIYDKIINYFEIEFSDVKTRLENGELDDYKERVIVSQKITDALTLLAPYVRSEWRARHLVKSAEALRKELLSVRDIVKKKPLPMI